MFPFHGFYSFSSNLLKNQLWYPWLCQRCIYLLFYNRCPACLFIFLQTFWFRKAYFVPCSCISGMIWQEHKRPVHQTWHALQCILGRQLSTGVNANRVHWWLTDTATVLQQCLRECIVGLVKGTATPAGLSSGPGRSVFKHLIQRNVVIRYQANVESVVLDRGDFYNDYHIDLFLFKLWAAGKCIAASYLLKRILSVSGNYLC